MGAQVGATTGSWVGRGVGEGVGEEVERGDGAKEGAGEAKRMVGVQGRVRRAKATPPKHFGLMPSSLA